MHMLSDAALRALVRQGVNLEIRAPEIEAKLAVDLVRLGGASQFTFCEAAHFPPPVLEQIASLGRSRVTFRFS